MQSSTEPIDRPAQRPPSTQAAAGPVGFGVVRLALGALLLAAALLKGYELATGPVVGPGLLHNRAFLTLVVAGEYWLGLWLVSGVWRRAAWIITVACFIVLAAVALGEAAAGERSCGCFGAVAVSPWLTSSLDLGAIGALLWWRPGSAPRRTRARRAAAIACLLAGVLGTIPGVLLMARYRPLLLPDQREAVEAGVDPDVAGWIGGRFPLLAHIDVGTRLSSGRWLVLLYHHDCPNCRRVLPSYEQLGRESVDRPEAAGVALIEMPPYAPAGPGPAAEPGPLRGHLAADRDWRIRTPLELALQDGVVRAARRGDSPRRRD